MKLIAVRDHKSDLSFYLDNKSNEQHFKMIMMVGKNQ
ncbi:hypothetical protein AAKU64_003214 [Undibacterium sp. GrIS 1.8]